MGFAHGETKSTKFISGLDRLSILAGAVSFVGPARATDIAVDGSYESAATNLVSTTPPIGLAGTLGPVPDGGWTPFTTYSYSSGYTAAAPLGAGGMYLRPYGDNGTSRTVSQINSLTRAITAAQIDASTGQYSVSAWFSSYKNQNDYCDFTLQFLDEAQNAVGEPVSIGGAAFVAALPPANPMRVWAKDAKSGLVPAGARYASLTTVGYALSGSPDGYVDLVSLDITSGFAAVQVSGAAPANNATGVSPGAVLGVSLTDGTAALNASSVRFWFDGTLVSPTTEKAGTTTTVKYKPAALMASSSSHTYQVAFNSSGGATPNSTNLYAFTVAPYVNVDLGTPLHLETFDSLTEGTLPSGWSVTNYTDLDNYPGFDLNNFHSDTFVDWTVINRTTLSNWLSVVPAGGDFSQVFNVAPNQVVNQALVTNLISNNFIIAVSDRSSGQKQVDYLYTKDYNVAGKTNIYLAFNNVYVQNQNNIAAIEYSINGGATWLPALYLLASGDILRDGTGNIDASNTFATVYTDVPNIELNTAGNGYYGQFIGVNSNLWGTLAPFLSTRGDDDQTGSKRVEIIRLAQADNQAAVRFRFALAGTWAWYFGIDDFGLYSVTVVTPPSLASGPTPAAATVAVGNSVTLNIAAALGSSPLVYQWRQNGTNLPGRTTQSLIIPSARSSDAGTYDVVVSNPGGAITSPPPAAVLTVINPAVFVTGQWDFNGDLTATVGKDLQYFDTTVQGDTTFGSTTDFGINDINGQPAKVMHFTPTVAKWGGYRVAHGGAPNGGGAYVNQYTVVYDLYYTSGSDRGWRSLWQTASNDGNDGDVFINTANGIGISSVYSGNVTADTWHRVAFAFDLTGPGEAPVLTKFIDGVKVGSQTSGLSAKDGRFALDPEALLFADENGDVKEGYVSSVQFSDGRRPDAFLAALGGPSAAKIPGAIKATFEGGHSVIRWTGGVPLQSADKVTGPWTVVSGATSPYTPPAGGSAKYFRPQIP